MTQVYDPLKPISGTTTFGGLYQIIRDHFAAAISDFSGTSFPSSPVVGQMCWRTDRGTYGYAYRYTGVGGESGWVEDNTMTSIGIEVIAARGSTASLDVRLDVALNEDGTLKASTSLNPSEWATMAGNTFTYSNTTTFIVDGDQTAIYYPRRRIKASLAGGAAYSEVVSATYGAPNTTVVIADAVLTNPITTVDHSLFAPTVNNGAMSMEMLGSSRCPITIATGTADAITATFVPAIALVDRQLCIIEATAVNATTTPTFAPNGLTARTIVKKGGSALLAGDIPAEHAICILEYNLSHTRWELLNPAQPYASAAEEFAGIESAKASSPSVSREIIINLKPVVNAAVNKLDIFTKSGGAAPDATNPIKAMIPDGNGYTQRSRAAAYLSGTSQIIMADAANYWSKGSLDAEIKTAWVYAIWDGAGIVFALGGYSGFNVVPTTTTATDDNYFLLENGSTYTRNAAHYCVIVGKIRYQYDTADAPDHTIQASGENAPQVIWNPKSDYGYQKALATTLIQGSDISEYSAVSLIVKQSGKYSITGKAQGLCAGSYATVYAYIKTGSNTYGSASYKAQGWSFDWSSTGGTNSVAIAMVSLNAEDTIHFGCAVMGASGNRSLFGDSSYIGVTGLVFERVD